MGLLTGRRALPAKEKQQWDIAVKRLDQARTALEQLVEAAEEGDDDDTP
jgi:predicted lipid-binding transport protein (Tim44 family)